MTVAAVDSHARPALSRPLLLAPPLAALVYPYLLKAFNALVTENGGHMSVISFAVLVLAVAVAAVGFATALRLGALERPCAADLLAKRLALLCVAAAPIYTATGVLLYMMGDPISDLTVSLVLWGGVTAVMLLSSTVTRDIAPVEPRPASARLRIAHGLTSLVILGLFLAMHIVNHLGGLASEAAHRAMMDVFRHLYRARALEPAIVALFLFQVGSGLVLLCAHTRQRADLFRTLQIASGAYLVFFILGHMNSVFFYARLFANIPTDWNFATGAPTGLVKDAWNVRLIPHYLIGVFFVLTHLALGARVVALAHGMPKPRADRLATLGLVLSALVAIAILAGMTGTHFAS